MAMILPHSAFIHIPRTGGTWVTCAIKSCGIKYKKSGKPEDYGVKTIHHTLEQAKPWFGNRIAFSFVRNPLTYLQSCWSRSHWPSLSDHYDINKSESFTEFVEAYLEYCPGSVSSLFDRFTGIFSSTGHSINYLGKYENQPHDLIRFLKEAGETFDEQIIRTEWKTPKRVRSRRSECAEKIKYGSKKLMRQVLEADKPIVTLCDYDTIKE